jgi:hypothetical protein
VTKRIARRSGLIGNEAVKTMSNESTGDEPVCAANLPTVLGEVLASVPITDIHTHIYPARFKELSLWGIDELLTYHYLVAEFFRFSDMGYDDFYALPKARQAELVWTTLFVDNSPVSEAARGVLTILDKLGLDVASRDLAAYRAWFAAQDHHDYIGKVFEIAGVKDVVMTNDPFDPTEREYWEGPANGDARFKAVLRLDPLLNDYANSWRQLAAWGYAVEATMNAQSVGEIRRFLRDWIGKLDALYLAASLPPDFAYPEDSLRGRCIEECILPVCRETGRPFALMVGAKPAVNPKLRVAGWGAGRANAVAVENLCRQNPDNKFLVTMLSRENQHELCVLARKFRNLLLFGCWWFLNNPVIIEDMTRMRMEMLGFSFVPQHSDARVIDQLIYKWCHSKAILHKVLCDKYGDLLAAGWQPTRAEITRDAEAWLGGTFRRFIGR